MREAGHNHCSHGPLSLHTAGPATPAADFPEVAPACPRPHLCCGGVPGPPRAFSPEFQTLRGSPNGEGPCSSGACSSPASHRGKGQGNMPRLGEGKAGPHLCALPLAAQASHRSALPLHGPHSGPASLSVGHHPVRPVSPGCPTTSPTSPTSPGLAATPTLSASVRFRPRGVRSRWVPGATPVGGGGGCAAGLPSEGNAEQRSPRTQLRNGGEPFPTMHCFHHFPSQTQRLAAT